MVCKKQCAAGRPCNGKCRALGRVGGLCRQGMAFLQLGEPTAAEAQFREALEETRELGLGPMLEAKAANGLGLALAAQERSSEAAALLGLAMGLIRERVGEDNRLYAAVRNNLCRVTGECRDNCPPQLDEARLIASGRC